MDAQATGQPPSEGVHPTPALNYAQILQPTTQNPPKQSIPAISIKPIIFHHGEPTVQWSLDEVQRMIIHENLQYAIGHDKEGCRVLHPEHISNDKKQEDGDSVEQTDQHAAAGHIDQTSNKYAALENGDGENNQLDKVPHEIVAAEAGHTTIASNVDKNLNANAPMFKPRNTTGSLAKEKSTKECVTSAFSKENEGQLVSTNQSCQEIPSQTYETTTKGGDREIEESEIHDCNVDEHGDDQNQINSQVQGVYTSHKMP
ncbi:hypothetical protein FXO38_18894, partial [Capsicum annuum]